MCRQIVVEALPGAIFRNDKSYGVWGHVRGSGGLNGALRRRSTRRSAGRSALQPPDQSAGNDQTNRNQLRPCHQAAEDLAASGIVAQKLYEVALDAIEDHEACEYLPIKFLAPEQPHQKHEIEKLGGGFDELRRLDSDTERSSTNLTSQGVGKDYAPEMICRLAVTASRRKAAETPEDMAESETGSESVGRAQHRHTMTPHVPGRHHQRSQ